MKVRDAHFFAPKKINFEHVPGLFQLRAGFDIPTPKTLSYAQR